MDLGFLKRWLNDEEAGASFILSGSSVCDPLKEVWGPTSGEKCCFRSTWKEGRQVAYRMQALGLQLVAGKQEREKKATLCPEHCQPNPAWGQGHSLGVKWQSGERERGRRYASGREMHLVGNVLGVHLRTQGIREKDHPL